MYGQPHSLAVAYLSSEPSTFTPQIDRTIRQVNTDDLERDHVLQQRIRLFGWIREEHLDIPTGEGSQGFMTFAQQGMLGE